MYTMSDRYYSKVEPSGSSGLLFTSELRRATRKIHSISDALVNSKLVLASSDTNVWSDALLIFYDVFKTLEEIRDELNMPEMNSLYVNNALNRTEAFRTDLNFYLGKNWEKTYVRRKEVSEYLDHLQELKEERPLLLCAYVYHLYMGLLSGGQIIKTKRTLNQITVSKLLPWRPFTSNIEHKVDIFEFGDTSISELKQKMKDALNNIAANLTAEQKCAFINESQMVFFHNNQIIKTVRGTFKAIIWIALYTGALAVMVYYIVSYFY